MEELLTTNRIFKQRLVDVGVLSANDALSWGVSGVLLRATGVNYDLRKAQPYELYDSVRFDVPVGSNGDCYDRYLLRIEEMRQSLRIIKQIIDRMPQSGDYLNADFLGSASEATPLYPTLRAKANRWGEQLVAEKPSQSQPKSSEFKTSMEALIKHFKVSSSGFALPAGETYCATEAPKGEFGVMCVSNACHRPYRVKIKSPDYASLQAIDIMCRGHYLADLVAIIGSVDVVFGSIDR
jgi:NADH-quinone oxidoreductase subunit D